MRRHAALGAALLGLFACGHPPDPAPPGDPARPAPTVSSAELAALERAVAEARAGGDVTAEVRARAELVAAHPDDGEARMGLAILQIEHQMYEPAIPHLRRVLELRPRDRQASMTLALALQNLGRFGEAADVLEELKRHRDDPGPGVRLGWLHLVRGDLDAAEAEFDAVLDQWPSDAGVRVGLGALRRLRGELEGSRAILEEAVSFRARDPQAHYQLALTLQALGRAEEARREMALFEEHGGGQVASDGAATAGGLR